MLGGATELNEVVIIATASTGNNVASLVTAWFYQLDVVGITLEEVIA